MVRRAGAVPQENGLGKWPEPYGAVHGARHMAGGEVLAITAYGISMMHH